MLNPYAIVDEDQFLAFSRAGADGFQFVLACKSLLLRCDVCKPMMPLLCWAHHLDNPCFIDVIRLSELRSQFRDDTYQWATQSDKMYGFSLNAEFGLRFNEVMRVAAEMIVLDSSLLNNDETVSHADDRDEIVGLELFDDLCPIELKFDVPVMNFVLMDALCLIEEWVFMVILWKIQALFLTLILDKNHFEMEILHNQPKSLIFFSVWYTKGKPDQGCKTIGQ
ncbi:hypothetical protein J1N35_025847 [Gossypium stocksii]|uniref:Uncharacterized protein n=1 Tax=Gossypium stocksii TaxID=47602 RepID=A0A9D3ZY82_9ROSI|nr:hypothetical protein J1N35_025847 [Gossypium stocksii]